MDTRPRKRQRGESLVSYFLIVGLVVLVCFTAAVTLGDSIKNLFGKASNRVNDIGRKIPGS